MRKRNGITFVEAVILLFCIVMLLDLLLPAIGPPIHHARKMQCVNNLRSLAQATIGYTLNKKVLPGHTMDFGTFSSGVDPGLKNAGGSRITSHRKIGTWAVALLPYLDQQATWERWTDSRYPIAFSGDEEFPVSQGTAGVGYCGLSVPNVTVFQCTEDATLDSHSLGRNSYVANAGMHPDSSIGSVSLAQSMSVANGLFNNKFAGIGRNGKPIAIGPDVHLEDMMDGLGSTLLLSENANAMPWHRAGFFDASDLVVPNNASEIRYPTFSRYTHGLVWHYEDDSANTKAPPVNPVHLVNGVPTSSELETLKMSPINCANLARPSSFHQGIVHAVFADGAVRTITDSIDYRVYQAMLTPCGSKSDVPDPTFVLTDEIAE
ncbi:DUF1559 domain-containing protein [Stieleria marina]|uniref:DUF1559 domain-containing protein n=1 Tax=Stieleria marina TaxID=1930275 RepID=A0A517NX30_9BACT|nr:hypothetical protein K239x_36850 [Planctomycetes bacterium K23_9]